MKAIVKITLMSALCLAFCGGVMAQAKKHTTVKSSPVSPVVMANGKLMYGKICISCHMEDGGGVQNMNPPLIKTTYVLGNKARLIAIVLKGFHDKIEIDDNTYSNIMPAQDFLKDQEIADVLTYIRNSFGNKASAVSLAEVVKARAAK